MQCFVLDHCLGTFNRRTSTTTSIIDSQFNQFANRYTTNQHHCKRHQTHNDDHIRRLKHSMSSPKTQNNTISSSTSPSSTGQPSSSSITGGNQSFAPSSTTTTATTTATTITPSSSSKRKDNANKRKKHVSRCLFGGKTAIEKEANKKFIENELKVISETDSKRWDFNFRDGKPLQEDQDDDDIDTVTHSHKTDADGGPVDHNKKTCDKNESNQRKRRWIWTKDVISQPNLNNDLSSDTKNKNEIDHDDDDDNVKGGPSTEGGKRRRKEHIEDFFSQRKKNPENDETTNSNNNKTIEQEVTEPKSEPSV